jgi:hypothetical protein
MEVKNGLSGDSRLRLDWRAYAPPQPATILKNRPVTTVTGRKNRLASTVTGRTCAISTMSAASPTLEMKMDQQRWYRRSQVAARYGGCGKTIERAVKDGRLPAPKHPFGNAMPYWDVTELDAHDRNLTARKSEAPARSVQSPTA